MVSKAELRVMSGMVRKRAWVLKWK